MEIMETASGDLKGRGHSDDPGIEEMIILKWNVRKRWEGAYWIHLVQDRDQLRVLVNTVMNFRVL
jgi:hypothetical protein